MTRGNITTGMLIIGSLLSLGSVVYAFSTVPGVTAVFVELPWMLPALIGAVLIIAAGVLSA